MPNKDQRLFLISLCFIIGLGFIHNWEIFIGIFIGLVLIFPKRFAQFLKNRIFYNMLLFSLLLSLIYVGLYYYQNKVFLWQYLTTFNLRILSIGLISFVLSKSISIFRVAAFSVEVQILTVLTVSMIHNYKRIMVEYKEILNSRCIHQTSWKEYWNYNLYLLELLYIKYRNDTDELTQIMESRGFYFHE